MNIKVGQQFLMSSKLTPTPRLFQYLGIDEAEENTTYNHAIVEVATGAKFHTELEWFNQRTIKEVVQ